MTDPLSQIAGRHGFSLAAVETAMVAIRRGKGTSAQFNHPEFGGMGQWMPGQIMIGDMFNNTLRGRVEALFIDLAQIHQNDSRSASGGPTAVAHVWYPREFGTPSTVGEQNNMRYAYYPESRRLLIEHDRMRTIYDTADHRITGVSQQQSRDTSDMVFTSQHGTVRVEELAKIGSEHPSV